MSYPFSVLKKHAAWLLGLSSLFLLCSSWAEANNGALKGEYNFSITRTCALDATGFDTTGNTFQRQGGGSNLSITLQGVATYDPATPATCPASFPASPTPCATGSFIGKSLVIALDADAVNLIPLAGADVTCPSGNVIYRVDADGSVIQQANCNLTFTAGGNAGGTGTLNGQVFTGQLSLDGTTVVWGTTLPAVETFTLNSAIPLINFRVCNGTGLSTSRR